ncbi:hypothetical protein SAMN04489760_10125 [Syntrophus gentianae]|uniref:Uncharacterized protein n=1 Tax=Syntrophus gentianae TaxID=43775 RepID=A0A1H7U884_9BACT|nr:hypothetical protein [Syntrophus gentianae]SEL93039.1 hypothetical protein SAMN04489760_10125 [Syntrophus gentianae]
MDEEWRDKAFVKNRWNLQEEDLVGIVFKRILIPCWKRPDGVYVPLSYEIPSPEEGCAYHRWMNAWYPCNENNTRDITEADIRKELDSHYIWFRQCDLEEAEEAGKFAPV